MRDLPASAETLFSTLARARAGLFLPIGAALLVGGCGRLGRYPPLGLRPAELAYMNAASTPAQTEEAPGEATADTLARIDSLRTQARQAADTFAIRAKEAERLTAAARGTGTGGDAWAAATVAMASLDSARSDTAMPLADLDSLLVTKSLAAAETEDAAHKAERDAVARADDDVAKLLGEEDARLAKLRAVMPG